jgi:hypothetical protein
MKKLICGIALILWGFHGHSQVVLTENFESYQGFGDALVGGWSTSGPGGFKVYFRGDTSITTNTKLCSININNNKRSDSLITPNFGPLTDNCILTFRARMCAYTGSFPTNGYIPSPLDEVSAWVSSDGGTSFSFLQNLASGYTQTGNKWNTFSLNLNGFSGQSVKVKIKVKRGTTNTEWYQDFDNFVATNITSIKGIQSENEFKISPNPSTGQVLVTTKGFSSRASIEVFNILGNKMLVLPGGQIQNQLDLSDLKKGVYLIKVSEGKQSQVKRLILH